MSYAGLPREIGDFSAEKAHLSGPQAYFIQEKNSAFFAKRGRERLSSRGFCRFPGLSEGCSWDHSDDVLTEWFTRCAA